MANDFIRSLPDHQRNSAAGFLQRIHIDPLLLLLLLLVVAFGLTILYSAVGQSQTLFQAQVVRLGLALLALVVAAQLPPRLYVRWAPFFYIVGVLLLAAVLQFGITVKGSQRWLEILKRRRQGSLVKIPSNCQRHRDFHQL